MNSLERRQKESTVTATHVSTHDALLCSDEDEADEDGGAQHADGTHQGIGALRLEPAETRGGRPNDHPQEPRHTGDHSEDQTAMDRGKRSDPSDRVQSNTGITAHFITAITVMIITKFIYPLRLQ